MRLRVPGLRLRLPGISVEFARGAEVRVLLNGNVKMTRHKAAAQAVHAALLAYGVPHGRVVVLGGRPDEVAAMDVTVRDAGRTEVEPGTLTAGASLVGAPEATSPTVDLGRVRKDLEAIVIRCREGDSRSDWLPVIDRLATDALQAMPAPVTS